jgi:predicted RNA binding protein YcfA (HicA-like mRNA interferase family)
LKKQKLLQKALNSRNNMRFTEMVTLVEAFGFELLRVKGSHHIFSHPAIIELVNLQEVNGQAKPYQIRQFLQLVERYDLELGEE